MTYKGIMQGFIDQVDALNDCELYLYISLAFMSITEWIEARYFLKKAVVLSDEHKYELIIDNFDKLIVTKNSNEIQKLLDARKYKYRKYEFEDEQFK